MTTITQTVFKATRFGETCHFGVESTAKAWAGKSGAVETITVNGRPNLSIVFEPNSVHVTREMLVAAHAVTMSNGVVLSGKLLEEIYIAMAEKAGPCKTCEALSISVLLDEQGTS